MDKMTRALQEELNRFLAERREAVSSSVRKVEYTLSLSGYTFIDPRTCRTVEVEVKK